MSYSWFLASLPVLVCVLLGACASERRGNHDHTRLRHSMVRDQIESRGVTDPQVLKSLKQVPRHEFVPPEYRHLAYTDQPLPIGHGQTISQPYIVGLMTELLQVGKGDTVLEIGTGSGYQAAVLSTLVDHVYTIEIVEPLAERARKALAGLGYENVDVRCGDGYQGWPEHAPFDGIIVTAAPPVVPEPLLSQMGPEARMVIPVGDYYQELRVLERSDGGFRTLRSIPVRFVPMVGDVQRTPDGTAEGQEYEE